MLWNESYAEDVKLSSRMVSSNACQSLHTGYDGAMENDVFVSVAPHFLMPTK